MPDGGAAGAPLARVRVCVLGEPDAIEDRLEEFFGRFGDAHAIGRVVGDEAKPIEVGLGVAPAVDLAALALGAPRTSRSARSSSSTRFAAASWAISSSVCVYAASDTTFRASAHASSSTRR